jgi:hypothetical protein
VLATTPVVRMAAMHIVAERKWSAVMRCYLPGGAAACSKPWQPVSPSPCLLRGVSLPPAWEPKFSDDGIPGDPGRDHNAGDALARP